MQTRVQILQKNEFEILKQILLYLYEILNLLYSEFVYGVVLMFFGRFQLKYMLYLYI